MVERVRPDHVIVDHLAFSARLALTGTGVRHADVVLGHPSALTVGDEVYGLPPAWPQRLQPDPDSLVDLRRQCEGVRDVFTQEWNAALAALDPAAPASDDAFAETGDTLLLNYPGELHPPERTRPAGGTPSSAAVRTEEPDAEVDAWLARGGSRSSTSVRQLPLGASTC